MFAHTSDDAKIFSLSLLLSSYFILNTMGVIDESAIDRLFLVSELSKRIIIEKDTARISSYTRCYNRWPI